MLNRTALLAPTFSCLVVLAHVAGAQAPPRPDPLVKEGVTWGQVVDRYFFHSLAPGAAGSEFRVPGSRFVFSSDTMQTCFRSR